MRDKIGLSSRGSLPSGTTTVLGTASLAEPVRGGRAREGGGVTRRRQRCGGMRDSREQRTLMGWENQQRKRRRTVRASTGCRDPGLRKAGPVPVLRRGLMAAGGMQGSDSACSPAQEEAGEERRGRQPAPVRKGQDVALTWVGEGTTEGCTWMNCMV